MRILHTADWHLGRTLHGVDLGPAHEAYLDHLVEVVRSERVDAVVVAGDVYDRAFPPLASVALLQSALVRLCELTHVVITPGNHDSATRLGFGSELFRERLSIRARALDAATPLVIPDARGAAGLLVYGVPYLDPDAARATLASWSEEPLHRSHEAALTTVVRRVRDELARRRAQARVPAVLVAHAFVQGGLLCDSERDIRVGGVDAVPAAVFDGSGLDYVALGHLHGPQRVGPEEGPGPRLRYAGAPVALSFSERAQTKSSVLVELDAGGVRSHELVGAPVVRRLSEVRGTLDEVLGRGHDARRDDWVRVVVTGRSRPHDLVSAVRKAFPHALEVHFEPDGADRPSLPGLAHAAADPLRVLTEFVTVVRRQAPDAAEQLVLREAYEAARHVEAGV